ncbi:hypothetical protein PsYK624_011020 [Phanerochaete sordida]|uniref:Uncharacterized protein n=1 Tax=Phanerochaete sordida TaxID=48140 RepID=A0A9P3FZ69_9APHY|nr:hypothetical protein PsYK624_011020 [Phanerochaete sordida]
MATPPPIAFQNLPRIRLTRDPWTHPSGRVYVNENIEVERDGTWVSISERFVPQNASSFAGESTRWYNGHEILTNARLRAHLGPQIVAFVDYLAREILVANGVAPGAHTRMHAAAQELGLEPMSSSPAAAAASADASSQRRAASTTAAGPSTSSDAQRLADNTLSEPMAALTVAAESDPEMPALESGSEDSEDE